MHLDAHMLALPEREVARRAPSDVEPRRLGVAPPSRLAEPRSSKPVSPRQHGLCLPKTTSAQAKWSHR